MTNIELLLALQEKDRRIRQLTREIEEIPARKKHRESSLQEHRQAHASAQEALKKNAVAIKLLENEIESVRQRILKLRTQQNQARTNEEYRAFEREIAAAEKEIRDLEDRELALMEETEGLKANVALMEQKLRSEQQLVEADHRTLDARLTTARSQLETTKTERNELAAKVPADWLQRYERVLHHLGDLAIVPVEKGGACGGCHMQLPPQVIQSAKRNDSMVSCSYCGRLLYWKP